jgi:hypothetical protein
VSAIGVVVFVLANGRRFPKINRPWVDVIWLSVGAVAKYLALFVLGPLALVVPRVYVNKAVAAPFAYAYAAMPLSWMICSRASRAPRR